MEPFRISHILAMMFFIAKKLIAPFAVPQLLA